MIYRSGKLDANPKNYRIINDIKELLIAIEDGFYPTGYSSKKEVLEIPEVKAELKIISDERDSQAEVDALIDDAIGEPKPVKKRRARRKKVIKEEKGDEENVN